MNINLVKQAITGEVLKERIKTAKEQRKPLVDGLLYENTILMVAAEPGCGKSTISTQIAIELASGLPVLGVLPTTRPLKVLYAQTERPLIEILERIELMSKVYPINTDNLYITEEYKIFNLLKEDHVLTLIECIHRDCPNPDVIFIDPIYPMVSGGLSKDEPASAFTRGMSLIQKATGACLYYNHHTSRAQYNSEGIKIEKDDPFYGSQWLKAHVTGSYYMKPSDKGVSMTKKKDNYKCLMSPLDLEYNHETDISNLIVTGLPAIERLKTYINMREKDQKTFTFDDMLDYVNCDTRTLRRGLCHTLIKGRLISTREHKHKLTYRVTTPQKETVV